MRRLHTLHSFDRYLSLYILFSRNPTLPTFPIYQTCVASAKHVSLPPPVTNPLLAFPLPVPSVDRMPDLWECRLRVFFCFRGYVTQFVS